MLPFLIEGQRKKGKVMSENYNSFEEYLEEQQKIRQKAIFSRIFFELEEKAYDIAKGKTKAIRMETADEMYKLLSAFEKDIQKMVDDLY